MLKMSRGFLAEELIYIDAEPTIFILEYEPPLFTRSYLILNLFLFGDRFEAGLWSGICFWSGFSTS